MSQGYEKATADRIAERTGVSVGTVYEYFPNKDAIFAALQLRWNEHRWALFEEARQLDPGDGLETVLRETIRARIEATKLDPALNTMLMRGVPISVTSDQAKKLHDQFLEASVALLSRFQDVIRQTDLPMMASLMMHATHAMIDNIAASDPDLLGSAALEDELVTMMLRYVEK